VASGRKIIYLASISILILLLTSTPGIANWTQQSSGALARLHAVYFLDANRGWVVGGSGFVLFTANGGETWKQISRPTSDSPTDVYFSDSRNGWILCKRSQYDLRSDNDPRSYLMRTEDGGVSWRRMDIPAGGGSEGLVRAVFMRNGRVLSFGEGGAVYLTRDFGANWYRRGVPSQHLLLGGTFINEMAGWLVGAGSTILQTTNGGDTWHQSEMVEEDNLRLNSVSFVDARQGWAVGNDGRILVTRNGGRDWHSQESNTNSDLFDVKFVDVLEGWAVGSRGTILHTIDSGIHWTTEKIGTTHNLDRIFFVGKDSGWIVGFGGIILRHSSGASTRTPQLKKKP
jgi:photosystem II stability/assembly factor-like uncharacterized protein